jgi:hypothetical protein
MESVSNITIDELERVKAAGELVIVPYDGRQYLPDDLRIVKEYRNSAAAGPLVDAHDRQRTNVPFEKLFDPSLFPELDYAEIRSRSLILGENKRVPVGEATPEHYRIHDQIEKANNEAQVKAYGEYVKAINRRKRLFARHPDCKTTDQLMRKLGLWK